VPLEQRVRAAYLAATRGAFGRRERLAAIRERLGDVPREALDATLMRMAIAGAVVLMPIDDPTAITPADEAAVLRIGAFTRHLLWFDD
jgi:hypothetical protein